MLPIELNEDALASKPLGTQPDVNNNAEGTETDSDVEFLAEHKPRSNKFSARRAPAQARVLRRQGSDEVDDDEYLHPAYDCSNCSDLFPTRNELLLHRLQAHAVQPYQCTECMATFPQPELLAEHRAQHTPDQPHACPQPGCSRRFSLKTHVKTHARALHPPPRTSSSSSSVEYRCDTCPNRVFQSATGLANHQSKVHQEYHSDERPFLCAVCRSTFRHRSNLTRHMKKSHPQ